MKHLAYIFLVSAFLTACGSSTPFKRGTPAPLAEKARHLDPAVFESTIKGNIEASCIRCHNNPAPTFEEAAKKVIVGNPEASTLVRRASGRDGHAEIWAPDSQQLADLILWVTGVEDSGNPPPKPTPTPTPVITYHLDRAFFDTTLKAHFVTSCEDCHSNPAPTFEAASNRVMVHDPENSILVRRASGQDGHDEIWAPNSQEMADLILWVNGVEDMPPSNSNEEKPSVEEDSTSNPPTDTSGDTNPPTSPVKQGELVFEQSVKSLIERDCKKCHKNPAPDYTTALTKIVKGKPEESLLYLKASGSVVNGKKHKAVWSIDSKELTALTSWIHTEGNE